MDFIQTNGSDGRLSWEVVVDTPVIERLIGAKPVDVTVLPNALRHSGFRMGYRGAAGSGAKFCGVGAFREPDDFTEHELRGDGACIRRKLLFRQRAHTTRTRGSCVVP